MKSWLGALLSLVATPSLASDHLMAVDEVMLSVNGNGGAQYIELHDAQNEPFPNGPYKLEIYDGQAQLLGSVSLPGVGGLVYYLVSTHAADVAFGLTGNAALTVALPATGQACFVRADDSKVHCLAWGCVQKVLPLATTSGPPPADGFSLQRLDNGGARPRFPTPTFVNWPGTLGLECNGLFGDDFETGGYCEWTNGNCA